MIIPIMTIKKMIFEADLRPFQPAIEIKRLLTHVHTDVLGKLTRGSVRAPTLWCA